LKTIAANRKNPWNSIRIEHSVIQSDLELQIDGHLLSRAVTIPFSSMNTRTRSQNVVFALYSDFQKTGSAVVDGPSAWG
jgi:hypothetical protein